MIFEITTREAAGMIATAFIAEKYLPDQIFQDENDEEAAKLIRAYGEAVSAIIFRTLRQAYDGHDEEWNEIMELSQELTSLVIITHQEDIKKAVAEAKKVTKA